LTTIADISDNVSQHPRHFSPLFSSSRAERQSNVRLTSEARPGTVSEGLARCVLA